MTDLNRTKIELNNNSWVTTFNLPDEIKCSDKEFKELINMKPIEHGQVKIYGKIVNIPRWQRLYGKNYYFSGLMHSSEPIPVGSYLERLLEWVKNETKKPYKQMLVNWYMTGSEYIGSHSDNEKQLVNNSDIYSFSFGTTRKFVIRSKENKDEKLTLLLENNTCIIMQGEMQKHYKHEVPKQLKIKDPRINVTFRLYIEDL